MKRKSNNPKGRPPGSKNKVTIDLRLTIKSFLDANAKDLNKHYQELDAKDKLLFFEKMVKYCVPSMQQTQINFDKLSDEDLDTIINTLK